MNDRDEALFNLLEKRIKLQQTLAPVLRRVGASHPERAKVNARRAIRRKEIKRQLRALDSRIASRCVEIFAP